MRSVLIILLLNLATGACYAQQDLTGAWKTVDEDNGEVRSVVRIYDKEGALYGEILRIFPAPGEDPDPVCNRCAPDDPRYGKKIVGMEILTGLKKDGTGGYILDPEEGKVYRCRMWREGENLVVRGYWGPFYRTQTWKKAD